MTAEDREDVTNDGDSEPSGVGRELERRRDLELDRRAASFLARVQLPRGMLEEFQRLKNAIFLAREAGDFGGILAVTSAQAREGVSFVTFHLAVSLAKGLEKSVLIVDGNFRRPYQHRLLGSSGEFGLSDVLMDTVDIHKAVRPTHMPFLAFLPAGAPLSEPAHLYRSDLFIRTVALLRERFDFVLIDTPALYASSDCLVMGPVVDQVLLVVRAHKTKHQVVQNAKEQITKHGGKLMGAVLNQRRFFIPGFIYRRL